MSDLLKMNRHDVVRTMIGPDEGAFFTRSWRRQFCVFRQCLPALRRAYGLDAFLRSYLELDYHPATYVLDVASDQRRFRVPANREAVLDALSAGRSIAVQLLRLPPDLAAMPAEWRWLTDLHAALCQRLLPDMPRAQFPGKPIEAVDVFCSRSPSTTGGHYDTGDVFYFALDGEKEWTLEHGPDLARACELRSAGLLARLDCQPRHATEVVTVSPGDCLYVPPHTYHRVRSNGPSLAVSFGLPTFSVLELLQHELFKLRNDTTFVNPLPSYPYEMQALSRAAGLERRERMQHLFKVLEEGQCSASVAEPTAGTPPPARSE
jgi:ribosomal protein L16 Arg81 hydroxylase